MAQELTTPTQPIEQPAPLPPKKSNLGMVIILIALLILIAGLAYFFLMPKSTNLTQQEVKPTPTNGSVTPQTEEEKEVNAVDVTDTTNSDLIDVEKDINSL